MIVHISSCSDSINLIELKDIILKEDTGFYMYPSTATLKKKNYVSCIDFVENMGNADIDEVFSKSQ